MKPAMQDDGPQLTLNVRHEIDSALVRAQVEKKVAYFEQLRITLKKSAQDSLDSYEQAKINGTSARWSRPPQGPGYVDPMIDAWIECEHSHYALVRVIELPCSGNRFVLVYGDVDDVTVTSGTGPFDSLESAFNWFLESGR